MPLTQRHFAVQANRLGLRLSRHWLLVFCLAFGAYVGLPWLAPVFMQVGWTGAGRAIYLVYSTQCHQLPERSYFLYGPRSMYTLDEIQAVWRDTRNPLILRQYVGDADLGWKVAWSDRMVSMYTSIFLGGLICLVWPGRPRWRPIPWWTFALLVLPLAADGGTHMLSELLNGGLGQGFRASNAWLAALTGGALPSTFYAGDALGSFNWWMRLATGLAFGLGVVAFAYPYCEAAFAASADEIERKLIRADMQL